MLSYSSYLLHCIDAVFVACWGPDDSEELAWVEHALSELEPSPELVESMAGEELEQERLLWLLCGQPHARISRLEKLYHRLPPISLLR